MFSDYNIGPEAMKFFRKAYDCQMQGKLEEAIFYYKKSLKIENTAEGRTFLGWVYSCMGRYKEAISECKTAITIDPQFGNPYNDIGSYLLQLLQPDEAMPWLEKALQANRYATPEFAYCNLGKAFEMKNLWPLAMEQYQMALQINPTYQPALVALGDLKARLN